MTNSEYFEKNNVPFAKAMEIFNEQKSKNGGTESFDKFLASEHVKFKIGDLIVLQLTPEALSKCWMHNVVFEVIDIIAASLYKVKFVTPNPGGADIGMIGEFTVGFIDRNCILY